MKNSEAKPDTGSFNPEAILTSQQHEEVFNNIFDVNGYGVGHTITPIENLDSILMNGIMGVSPQRKGVDRGSFFNKNTKEKYIDDLKKNSHPPEVFFNISGRVPYDDESSQDLNEWNFLLKREGRVDIVFDISSFQEVKNPTDKGDNLKVKNRQFVSQYPPESLMLNDNGETMATPDIGFKLSPRVPSRMIKGIVLYEYDQSERLEKAVEQILFKMSENGKFFPIYDIHGNLLWPKKISHDEIVKMRRLSE